MIKDIEITNFRCFKEITAAGCGKINVIVGDNGVGKTGLLEAIFLALSGGTDLALRYRQQRGLEGNFSGTPRSIEEAIFGDLFFQRDTSTPISIELRGDGPEARSVYVSRGLQDGSLFGEQLDGIPYPLQSGNLVFQWRDAFGVLRPVVFQVGPNNNFLFGNTGEDLPGFFYFSSQQPMNSVEAATRFSELSRSRREKSFVSAFTKEYPWIEDLNIEVIGGAAVLHATVAGLDDKIPVSNVSGAISRMISVLLAVMSQPKSVVLVDELENGIYHKHYTSMWRTIISFCKLNDTQLFTTTHSHEWIEALLISSQDDLRDVVLWRLERGESGSPILRRFSGEQAKAAIDIGGELR